MLINRYILIFYSSNNYRYVREYLYFKHVIDIEVSNKVLYNALLATYLVNNRGKKDSFLSIDLYNKHYNERVKDI